MNSEHRTSNSERRIIKFLRAGFLIMTRLRHTTVGRWAFNVRYWTFAFSLCIIFITGAVTHASDIPLDRPKVGLVLGGGGARGAAHIGVIKILEELNIPVDVIVGTSMGAIVGGLYAAGLSPEELEELAYLDWENIFRDRPPREKLPYRRKQEDGKYIIDFGIGYRGGSLILPQGFIQGQKQIKLLKGLTIGQYQVDDFDKLPIPFRAVATDVETGEAVVIGSGDLADAIRASMTVPGIFSPVKIDGKLLVDGGLSNNLPMDVARNLGAEILIVVDVGSPLNLRDELVSMVDIALQLSTFLVRLNSDEQLRKFEAANRGEKTGQQGNATDFILIHPELGDLSSSDFISAPKAVLIGEIAALKNRKQLNRLAVQKETWDRYLKKQRQETYSPPVIDFIDIRNNTRLSLPIITSYLDIEKGKPLDLKKLDENIADIYGLDFFERVEYNLVEKGDQTGLVIEAQEKSWGPNFFRFGLNLMTDFRGNNDNNILINFTRMPVNALGGEWSNEVQLGDTTRLFSEFFQPLDYSFRYFVAPYGEYSNRYVNAYHSGSNYARYRVKTFEIGFDVGRQLGRWGEFRIGIKRGSGRYDLETGDPVLPSLKFDEGAIFSSISYDKFDHSKFPKHGAKAYMGWTVDRKALGADEDVEELDLSWTDVNTWGKNTLAVGLSAQTLFNNDVPVHKLAELGGFLNLSGYAPQELTGGHSGLARLICFRETGKIGALPVYIGGSVEGGNVWRDMDDVSFDSIIIAGSVMAGIDTPLGPFFLAYGHAEGGRDTFYLFLGQFF